MARLSSCVIPVVTVLVVFAACGQSESPPSGATSPTASDPVTATPEWTAASSSPATTSVPGSDQPRDHSGLYRDVPDVPPDARLATIDDAIQRAHELAPGMDGQPARVVSARLLTASETWVNQSGGTPLAVSEGTALWHVDLVDATYEYFCPPPLSDTGTCVLTRVALLMRADTGEVLATTGDRYSDMTAEQAATYAVEVLSGQHWDNPEARAALHASELNVVGVEQIALDGEPHWEVRLTGRFEIHSCPVRRFPTPGTRICDEGDRAVVRFRASDGLHTTVEITTVSGAVTYTVNAATWIDPTPSS